VICLVEVINGSLHKGERISSKATGLAYEVLDIGILHAEPRSTGVLHAGQVGYIITGMKSTREARVGDTFYLPREPEVEALPGFKPAKPMVFSGVYPEVSSEYDALRAALNKLTLNDASIDVQPEVSAALGTGFRCGFLGLLHLDVVMSRIKQEYNLEVVVTPPTVPYEVTEMRGNKEVITSVSNPANMPPNHTIVRIREPTVNATIISPAEFVGSLLQLCSDSRGMQIEYNFLDGERVLLKYRIPLAELITGFYDSLKSRSSGYASLDYEEGPLEDADVVQLSVRVNNDPIDAMTSMVHRSKAISNGKNSIARLKEILPRQLYQVAIQAVVENKVVARETLSAMRKDVTAKCYGGDVSRKKKLLNKQKEGKKRMKTIGTVEIPQEAFVGLLRQNHAENSKS